MHRPAPLTLLMLMYVVLVVAAAILVASHTPFGAALTPDSLAYLAAARNVLDGNGIALNTYALNGPTIEPMTIWPPLYPLLLAGIVALASLAGTSDVVAISVFNFFALAASLLLFFRIASLTASSTTAVIFALVMAILPSLQLAFMYAWSEVLFIPLILAAFFILQRYLLEDRDRHRFDLYAVALLIGLATYTRYVGLAFFLAAAVSMVLYGCDGLSKRVRSVTAVSAAYLVVVAPLLIWNLTMSGALSGGDRGAPNTSLTADVSALVWYLYLEAINLHLPYTAAIVSIAIASAVWLILSHSPDGTRPDASFRSSTVVVPFLFAACYLAFLLISRKAQIIDLDTRMLSVAAPFILLGLLGVYQQLSLRSSSSLAALPFLLPLAAYAINAVQTHSSILTGWREHGEPQVLGVTYRSITGRRLDALRIIDQQFSLATGDIILTDFSQPSILDYLFPEADVRTLPDRPSAQDLDTLRAPLKRRGLAIVGSGAWSRELTENIAGDTEVYRTATQFGGPDFTIIRLPVESP